jgi:hypothetical protein
MNTVTHVQLHCQKHQFTMSCTVFGSISQSRREQNDTHAHALKTEAGGDNSATAVHHTSAPSSHEEFIFEVVVFSCDKVVSTPRDKRA